MALSVKSCHKSVFFVGFFWAGRWEGGKGVNCNVLFFLISK